MTSIQTYINQTTKAAPLAVFRIFFGLMMFISIIRFWANGWIEKLYIEPTFFFSYYGFEWVKPLGDFTYVLFTLCGISALAVAVGFRYRIAIVIFFLSFTYIELMDKTTYLNHYYFVSVLSFLMIFLPAEKYFSWDAKKGGASELVPKWSIDSVKLLLGIVYFYAGLAKLNSDWLFRAMPLKIWLPGRYDIPILGDFLHQEWVIYAFSWGGALYDLTIPFLLLWKRSRLFAFVLVVVFHVLTRVLFPIGMFPYIMIVSALIFFDASVHEWIIRKISVVFNVISHLTSRQAGQVRNPIPLEKHYQSQERFLPSVEMTVEKEKESPKWKLTILAIFFTIQLLLPWRYLMYPGELFWTEEGFRFSWRVMLMEKAGYANFKIVDRTNNETFYIDNSDFLTSFQEKQMSFQPDFILDYAHYLRDHFAAQGKEVEVYVESYVALNGRRSQPYIDPSVDLANQKKSFKHKNWILPFKDEIKGI
ncbi:Vitamin K-dependent gamma-carboxylase [Ekhidna lutea]|uniref:Vitamin K-dependent gamma-carboxylase n=1 Tax=Ekhidna lutea TaxID=447679 RepID=A0A239F8R3_EKHLU|nr:HTTM domain-containing protein [Ekhidna lutea]SNS52723.1 Vitamin K-dependent gamma-carboxylase [Ekhidna lutea]